MVVVTAVDSVRRLHGHVAVDDANEWGRRGLDHGAVGRKQKKNSAQ